MEASVDDIPEGWVRGTGLKYNISKKYITKILLDFISSDLYWKEYADLKNLFSLNFHTIIKYANDKNVDIDIIKSAISHRNSHTNDLSKEEYESLYQIYLTADSWSDFCNITGYNRTASTFARHCHTYVDNYMTKREYLERKKLVD